MESNFTRAEGIASCVAEVAGFRVIGMTWLDQPVAGARFVGADLILLDDQYLRSTGGVTSIKQVVKANKNAEVILLARHRETSERRKCRGLKIDYCLPAPVSRSKIQNTLKVHRSAIYSAAECSGGRDWIDPPRGYSEQTINALASVLRSSNSPTSIQEACYLIRCSRQTVQRYMKLLEVQGYIKAELSYGGIGRPPRRYSWQYG